MCGSFQIREYHDGDADGWLRCRLLSFFYTSYYDDVAARRTEYEKPSLRLVAVDGDQVVGLLDTVVDGPEATIEVLAVHPDHARRGIGTGLLERCLADPLLAGVATVDAWTREDEPANHWYRRNGFVGAYTYVHVHKEHGDDPTGFESPPGMSQPLRAFLHAPRELETAMRERFGRVYVCRQYVLRIGSRLP